MCARQGLDVTPGNNPGSVFAFCVASTCQLSSRRVVLWVEGGLEVGGVATSSKITLFKFVIFKRAGGMAFE